MFENDVRKSYWINSTKSLNKSACPNVSLFRFIGSLISSLNKKVILEIGFNDGCDILECKKRGAISYGVDINPLAVESLKKDINVEVLNAGVDKIPFNEKFDLIFIRDTIYYLKDDEINFLLLDIYSNLKNDGIFILQFIEKDIRLEKYDPLLPVNFKLFENSSIDPIYPSNNPIRFLKSKNLIENAIKNNFNLVATKRLIQSYDLNEERFRIERYLAFKINK